MTAQWIAVVAAVIVVGVGIRHVYVEIAESPPVASIVEREQISETGPVLRPAEKPWFEQPGSTPSAVEHQPASVVLASTPTLSSEPAPAPVYPKPAAQPNIVYRPVAEDPPEQVVQEVTAVEYEQTESLVERLRVSLGDPHELTDTRALESERNVGQEVAPDPVEQAQSTQVTGPPDVIGGVSVESLRWNGRETQAGVRTGLKHGVTLVTIGRGGGGGLGHAAGRRSAPTQVVAPPNEPETSNAGPGIYYFRLFAGSSVESLDPDSHGLLGEDLPVLPSGEASPWMGLLSTNESVGEFGIPSMVALDPVWLPVQQTHVQSDFVAAVGGQLYEVMVAGAPSGYDGWHEMNIEIASRFPDRRRREIAELQILVQQNRFVVLLVPGVSLPARFSDSRALAIDTILVAFTPLSSPKVDAIGAMDLMFESDPRTELIAVEGPQPVLPVGFPPNPATLGDLRLRVLVLTSGEPLSVVAIETAIPDGEYLVEPIVSAVRQWRFHPPALDPAKIGGYFDITVGPGGEMAPDSVELASEPRPTGW